MKKTAVLVVGALMLSGCAQQTFVVNDKQGNLEEEAMQSFFVSGIGQKKTIDAASICGGAENVAKVEVQQTFLDGFLGVVTFGIYTPRDARVYCR
ncbi:Bor family protein [Enterovibrio norvegicus]|uniref:Lipoprotein bor n=1 Tax=Enterovibrio norvegicus TaxID=188144 RepID=A0A2N7L8E2_9GAMM|nr:Bor family protein [Enterovibrio norvegicus]MCC4796630.1 Bor family protein [Enterovibrio norvegicus]PMH65792.1 lipoprotein bor [Enterovibrio norvegicus]PMI26141.1 lipoprotein bor [Enterovibrio norvegicus]PMI35855.1 lipoprotein bor [Enterovibrio norvegicus]PML77403.1 lipoprotein bor [Enterovibrio norvegicus]